MGGTGGEQHAGLSSRGWGEEVEVVHRVATGGAHDSGPISFRFPRGAGTGIDLPQVGTPLKIGKGRIVREGKKVAFLSFGARLAETLNAADELETYGLSCTVADARFAKPLDTQLIDELVENHELLVTLEEGATGGFGSLVLHHLAENGLLDGRCDVRTMHLPDEFTAQATPEAMYHAAALDAEAIVHKVLTTLRPAIGENGKSVSKVVSLI